MPPAPLGPSLPPTEHLPSEETTVLSGHEGPVLAVRFNRTGTYCLTCGKDRALKLWNPHKGTLIKSYAGHGYDVRDVAVSSDNSKIASCGGDRQLFLWDVGTGKIIRKFKGHEGAINAVAYGAGDQVLATAGYDQAVNLWDCRANAFHALQTMRVFADSVTSVATTDRSIVAGSVDGTVRCFDLRAGACYADELGHPVASMALSHDGNCLLAACLDSRVRLLDREGGELLAMYQGHKHESARMDCAFTVSDAYAIGSSEDGRVLFWDLVEQTVVHTLQAHTSTVCALAMHPSGECLLTSGTDGSVRVWR